MMKKRLARVFRTLEHYSHQYQILLAIIVASIILTTAIFMRPSPLIDGISIA